MIKDKKVDYKDTNVALIGTDADKEARYKAASSEEAFKGAGSKVGLEIWRVENEPATETHGPVFGVKRWPAKQYGAFYQGDSFIVMNTYKKDPKAAELSYDLHFWLGKESSQDERGVAAYKTVELDDLLHQAPVQHRETQGHESQLFLSYFPKGIRVQEGGHASGFHHVDAVNYKPRLLEVQGRKHARAVPVALQFSSLNDDDVFVLDLGKQIIQWNGATAHPLKKRKGNEICEELVEEREGKSKHTILDSGNDKGEEGALFWNTFGGRKPVPAKGATSDADVDNQKVDLRMFNLSNESGTMKITKIDTVRKESLNPNDVTVVDSGIQLYVWVGKGASSDERKLCMRYADEYITKNNRPAEMTVTRILDGNEPHEFHALFAGQK